MGEIQEDPAFSQPSTPSSPRQMDSLWLRLFLPVGRTVGRFLCLLPKLCWKMAELSWLHRRTWRSSRGSPGLVQDHHQYPEAMGREKRGR